MANTYEAQRTANYCNKQKKVRYLYIIKKIKENKKSKIFVYYFQNLILKYKLHLNFWHMGW